MSRHLWKMPAQDPPDGNSNPFIYSLTGSYYTVERPSSSSVQLIRIQRREEISPMFDYNVKRIIFKWHPELSYKLSQSNHLEEDIS